MHSDFGVPGPSTGPYMLAAVKAGPKKLATAKPGAGRRQRTIISTALPYPKHVLQGTNMRKIRIIAVSVTTRSPKHRTSSIKPPNPQKDPQRSAKLPPMPTPTSANSDTSPANSDGPLANFGACPAATDTYPGLPKPREPPPLFLIFAHPSLTQHPASSDLFRNITTTSEQPAIPSTYQRGTIFDHN
ncbi:hypothetical protein E4T56_gene3646 [Termitomyces sp. T112]|nr:hypothetical protein E4T56_gene3646 [Termitomyces sp. T112]